MDPGVQGGYAPPPPQSPVKISHKKMAVEGSHIDFMFLDRPPSHWIRYYTKNANAIQVVSNRMEERTSGGLFTRHLHQSFIDLHLYHSHEVLVVMLRSILEMESRLIPTP